MVQHGLIVQTFTHCFGLPIVLLDFLCDLHRKFCEKLGWDNEERDRKDGEGRAYSVVQNVKLASLIPKRFAFDIF